MEARIHVTVQGPMETKIHCDTVGPQAVLETTVALQGLVQSRPLQDLVEPRKPFGHCKASWKQGAIVTLRGPMEKRDHCHTVGAHGTEDLT